MPVAPYDPYAIANPWWKQQQAQQPGAPFSQPPAPEQPKQWWQGLPGPKSQIGQSANQPGQSANSPNSPNQPGLYDMLLNLGRMSPADYNKAIKGGAPSGSYGAIPGMGAGGMNFSPASAAMVSPWAWLGSMYGGGGTPG